MEITEENIKSVLGDEDHNFIYSDRAQQAFGMPVAEFEDAVKEYYINYKKVGLADNAMLFHIKADSLLENIERFHSKLDELLDLQDASGSLAPMEVKAILSESKKVFIEGVNILAPYAGLLLTGIETKNYA